MDRTFHKDQEFRIGIFYPVDFLESVPIVRNMIVMFAERGFQVEVFAIESATRDRNVQFHDRRIHLHLLTAKGRRGKILGRIPNLLTYTRWGYSQCTGKEFLAFIGVDPAGLVAASALGLVLHTPCLYLSLELILSSDPARMYRGYKILERWFSRQAAMVITQDQARARLMAEDNGIPMDRFAFLPNSPLGTARREKQHLLHGQFGFHADDRILLHAGSIGDEFQSRELACSAQDFPKSWRLVFQSRRDTDKGCNHLGPLVKDGKVHISPAVPYEKLRMIVDSADIGIALYHLPQSPNVVHMGKSSGKILQYLQCGLPVIATRMPGWEEAFARYNSGISVDSPNEVREAAERIYNDYDSYSRGAIEHFESELRFEPAFGDLVGRLPGLLSGRRRVSSPS